MARILVVDDEENVRAPLHGILTADRHEVLLAENAVEAIQLLDHQSVDVIITDIILPQMSGIELLQMVRSSKPELSVIIMTGDPTLETATEAVRAGASDYLIKPINGETLKRAVKVAVKKKRDKEETGTRKKTIGQNRERYEELFKSSTLALHDSEKRFRDLLESTSDCIWEVDDKGSYTYVSSRVSDILGYEPGEILGNRIFEYLPTGEKERAEELFNEYVISKKPFAELTFRHLHKDTREIVMSISGVPIFGDKQKFVGFRGISRDITGRLRSESELRHLEARYRSLFSSMREGVALCEILFDPDGQPIDFRVLDANPGLESNSGISCDKAIGAIASELFDMGEAPFLDTFYGVIKTGKPVSFEVFFPPMNRHFSINVTSPAENLFAIIFEDITEKKVSEEKYRAIVNTSYDAILVTDLTGKITECNPATVRLFGYDNKEEFLDKDGLSFISLEDRKQAAENLTTLLTQDKIQNIEYNLLRKDGTEFPGILAGALMRDTQGNPHQVVTIVKDITEWKRTEQALRESEERYRSLFENMISGVAVYEAIDDGMDFVIKDFNVTGERLEGLNREQLIGKKVTEVFPPVVESGLFDVLQRVWQSGNSEVLPVAYFELEEGEGSWRENRVYKLPDGEVVAIYNVISERIKSEQQINAYRTRLEKMVVERTAELEKTNRELQKEIDVRSETEKALRSSEQKYRNLFDSMGDAIFIYGLDGEFLQVNQVACDRLGYSPEDFRTMTPKDIDSPESAAQVQERIEQLVRQRQLVFEVEHVARDGRVIPSEVSARFIEYNGKPAIQSVARDISDRKEAERQLQQAKENLEKRIAERTVELTRINENLTREVAERKLAEGQLLRYQDRLRSLTSELTLAEERERRRIAGGIHDRIGSNLALVLIKLAQMKTRCPVDDINAVYNEAIDLIKDSIRSGHSLIFDLSPPILYDLGLEAALKALLKNVEQYDIDYRFTDDHEPKPLGEDLQILIYQSVRELLVNVVKHAKASEVNLSISRRGNTVRLSVEDDGVGFDTSKDDDYEAGKGGFGLFHIRERMSYMGGGLTIQSKAGEGTRATLVAPCISQPQGDEESNNEC